MSRTHPQSPVFPADALTRLPWAALPGKGKGSILLEDYRATLNKIRKTGYVRYAVRQFRPYLFAAVSQFSPRRRSLTEKLLARRQARAGR